MKRGGFVITAISILCVLAIFIIAIFMDWSGKSSRNRELKPVAAEITDNPPPLEHSVQNIEPTTPNLPDPAQIRLAAANFARHNDFDKKNNPDNDFPLPPEDAISAAGGIFLGQSDVMALMDSTNSARLLEDITRKGESFIDCTDVRFESKVRKGETIEDLLYNASANNMDHYLHAAAGIFPLHDIRQGQPYRIVIAPETGRIIRFEYDIGKDRRLVIEGDKTPEARLEDIEYLTLLERREGVISDSLFNAVADLGETPQLTLKIVSLFGSEINFVKHLQEGDSFSVLIEKKYRDGKFVGYGRLLAARFKNRGKVYEAYMFRDAKGVSQYFNAKGENLHKTLLQSPLAFTRMTSNFSHQRLHPILGVKRPHLGVDYGAPTGTPVKAVGDGVVTARAWTGGYGNQIILKHAGGLESMYAHLSGFARGLKKGQTVRQGQVIGFVGSTGLATGPHLDFRLRQNGKFINPAKAINPRGAPVPPQLKKEFQKVLAMERDCLNGDKIIENYRLDSILPQGLSYIPEDTSEEKQIAPAKKSKVRNRLLRRPVLPRKAMDRRFAKALGKKAGVHLKKRKTKRR